MPKKGKKYYTITELLTKDEIARAMNLYGECKKGKEDFNKLCAEQIVGGILSRVNGRTGLKGTAEYWANCIEYYLSATSREERRHLAAHLNAVQ
jgi:hypothetical protein